MIKVFPRKTFVLFCFLLDLKTRQSLVLICNSSNSKCECGKLTEKIRLSARQSFLTNSNFFHGTSNELLTLSSQTISGLLTILHQLKTSTRQTMLPYRLSSSICSLPKINCSFVSRLCFHCSCFYRHKPATYCTRCWLVSRHFHSCHGKICMDLACKQARARASVLGQRLRMCS